MSRRIIKLIILSILAVTIIVIGIRLFLNPVKSIPSVSISTFSYKNSEKYTQASSGSVQNISNLEINWVSGNVEVIVSDGKSVEFKESSDKEIPQDERMCYWQDGNTLKIQFTSSGLHKVINNQKKLLVSIPSDIKLKNINLDVVSADVQITGINSDEADFNSVSGDLTLKDSNTPDLSFDSVSGNLYSEDIGFISFEGDSTSGDFSIKLSSFLNPEKIEIDTVSGNIELDIPKEKGFEMNYSTVSGDIFCNSEISTISKKTVKRGDGSLKIELDSVSGDICIK